VTLPNFLIVGAAKSGTSSLYEYLSQHPDVYLCPVKEPCYFSDGNPHLVRTDLEYEALFDGRTSEKAVGEASASYLYDPEAPGKIKALLDGVKIIIILRNPVNRAYSQWSQIFYQLGYEKLSFENALEAEDDRISQGKFGETSPFYYGLYRYFHAGLYHDQVKRYFDTFDRERVQVHIFEEFIKDPIRTCKEIFTFIGVDPDFIPVTEKHNVAAAFRVGILHKFLLSPPAFLVQLYQAFPMKSKLFIYNVARSIFRMNLQEVSRPPMKKHIRDRLLEKYWKNIEQLEVLLGRDLSIWYKKTV
jgi:Sulfotransferase domain